MQEKGNDKIENLMKNAITKIKDIIDVNTVIGNPLTAVDGTMIIPITKVTVGFVAGGGEYTQNIPLKIFFTTNVSLNFLFISNWTTIWYIGNKNIKLLYVVIGKDNNE